MSKPTGNSFSRAEQNDLQTGSERRYFRQGDRHPRNPSAWFWRYQKSGRENWVTASGLENLRSASWKAKQKNRPTLKCPQTELLTKRCPQCKELFQTRKSAKRWCSDECRPRTLNTCATALGLAEWGEDTYNS